MHASAVADVGATGTSRHGSWLCKPPSVEPVLRSIIGGLFAEGLVPPGSAIDAGANSGEEACYYAERQPQRIVHAVEPVTGNVDWMARKYAHLTNLRVLRGGLGSEGRWVRDRKAGAKRGGQDTQVEGTMDSKLNASESDATSLDVFRVHRVDDLFEKEWKGETLGFAHFDVEGGELSVLRGARATILRDRPLFTVEVHVHNKPNTTRALLREIRELGYVSSSSRSSAACPSTAATSSTCRKRASATTLSSRPRSTWPRRRGALRGDGGQHRQPCVRAGVCAGRHVLPQRPRRRGQGHQARRRAGCRLLLQYVRSDMDEDLAAGGKRDGMRTERSAIRRARCAVSSRCIIQRAVCRSNR